MAEEKKEEPKKEVKKDERKVETTNGITPGCLLVILAGATIFLGSLAHKYTKEAEKTNKTTEKKNDNQIIVYLEEDAEVYSNLTDALCKRKGAVSYYGTAQERYVLSTFYEYNNEYSRFDTSDINYYKNIEYISSNGGILVCYLTSLDGITPEGFYPADCITINNPNIKEREGLDGKQK